MHTSTYHTETWLVDDIRHPHVIHMSSEGGYIIHTLVVILFIYPIIYNSVSAHSLHKCTLSMPCRCCPHMYTGYTDLVGGQHTSSICHSHVICRFIHHPHIICSTPHGHYSSKLSFHCDRNWLLNRICHKNVELFHFRITQMTCEIICVDGFVCMSHLDIVHMLFEYLHVIRILSEHMHMIRTLFALVLDMFLFNRQC